MRVKKITKKGVSPLVATTMLVGFTVAVVAMVVVWSRGYIEERAAKEEALANTKLKCETVKFTVEEACPTGDQLDIKLKNLANQQIDSWILRIKGKNGNVQATEQGLVVKGLETKELNLGSESFSASYETIGEGIDSVEVIPAIKAGRNKYVPCSGQMLEVRAGCLSD